MKEAARYCIRNAKVTFSWFVDCNIVEFSLIQCRLCVLQGGVHWLLKEFPIVGKNGNYGSNNDQIHTVVLVPIMSADCYRVSTEHRCMCCVRDDEGRSD
jgi:hypothetical protein